MTRCEMGAGLMRVRPRSLRRTSCRKREIWMEDAAMSDKEVGCKQGGMPEEGYIKVPHSCVSYQKGQLNCCCSFLRYSRWHAVGRGPVHVSRRSNGMSYL